MTCCRALSYFLPGKVATNTTTTYQTSQSSYWSAQEQSLHPACIVIPTSSQDVSTAVIILSAGFQLSISDCKFAVRGGGHTPHAEAANIEGGVTIDLQSMNQVTVSSDKTTVSIGAGNQWKKIYPTLDGQDLAMAGGRSPNVGVAGLLTGGGVSFFSGRYGFACNNIQSYEVVLASGSIVTASASQNPTLYKALKGGSNNFGIVTKFTAELFAQPAYWGGQITQPVTDKDAFFPWMSKFSSSANYDPYSAIISTFAWLNAAPLMLLHTTTYTNGSATWPPPAFEGLDEMPKIASTVRKDHTESFVEEVGGPHFQGAQEFFMTISFVNDPNKAADFMSQAWTLADSASTDLAAVVGLIYTMTYQPLPTVLYSKDASSNVMGLDRFSSDLINVLFTLSWQLATDNDVVYTRMKKLEADLIALEKQMGIYNEWIYLNYAAAWQQPIQSYGATNVAYMKSVSKQYDPKAIFQKAVPGGFKLGA